MSEYTRVDRQAPDFDGQNTAPDLIFRKWQAWDAFTGDFDRKEKLRYLENTARAIHGVLGQSNRWRTEYLEALRSMGAETRSYKTVWRLIVGWSTNPALESGLTLHHLYGFPYIPGSTVKGLVHHVAEMELAQKLLAETPATEEPLPSSPSQELLLLIEGLERIKNLFGSIHLVLPKSICFEEAGTTDFTVPGPKNTLLYLKNRLRSDPDLPETWKTVKSRITRLLEEQVGGLLRFYDAIPNVGQPSLLQPDIVNCHYSKYYQSEGKDAPPSDDDQPKPEAKFTFPFRLKKPDDWDDEQYRAEKDYVLRLLDSALANWGIGAKTAAGYGYFLMRQNQQGLKAVKPPDYASKVKPASKLSGISKDLNQEIWKRIAEESHIAKVTGKPPRVCRDEDDEPACQIRSKGRIVNVSYVNGNLFCQVEVRLDGVEHEGHAQYIWENVILPVLAS